MLDNVSSPLWIQKSGAPGAARQPDAPATNARFQELLDKLRTSASELEARVDTTRDARDLSRAVETAQESLHDALTLRDELLEAFRAAQQRPM